MEFYVRVGEQTGVPAEKTLRQPVRKSVPHNIIRGENSLPQPGIEPSPSNIGDKFAWSECTSSNPLNLQAAVKYDNITGAQRTRPHAQICFECEPFE